MEKNNTYNDTTSLIQKLIKEISDTISFYNILLNQISDEEDISIIQEMINDEMKHEKILGDIFFNITNTNIRKNRSIFVENRSTTHDYKESLKDVLFNILDTIKNYQILLNYMMDSKNYNLIMEILINKLRHADLINYLILKHT